MLPNLGVRMVKDKARKDKDIEWWELESFFAIRFQPVVIGQ